MKKKITKAAKAEAYVVAECIQCKSTRKIFAGQVDQPMCHSCFMPMVAKEARRMKPTNQETKG